MGFWYWAWCTTGAYQWFNRLAHRFNWHHCTVLQPFHSWEGRQHWCQWCGLRYVEPHGTPVVWKDEDLHKTFAYDQRAAETQEVKHETKQKC